MARYPPMAVLHVCLSFAATLSSGSHFKFPIPENWKSCSDNHCGNTSYETILQWYKGILLTEGELKELKIQRSISRNDFVNNQLMGNQGYKKIASNGDGDACCETSISFKVNYLLTNILGQEKSIVHMPDHVPPHFQFIPYAECLVQHQNCDGACIVEPVLLTLLVLHGENLVFDFFLIPGYCSCKNIYGI